MNNALLRFRKFHISEHVYHAKDDFRNLAKCETEFNITIAKDIYNIGDIEFNNIVSDTDPIDIVKSTLIITNKRTNKVLYRIPSSSSFSIEIADQLADVHINGIWYKFDFRVDVVYILNGVRHVSVQLYFLGLTCCYTRNIGIDSASSEYAGHQFDFISLSHEYASSINIIKTEMWNNEHCLDSYSRDLRGTFGNFYMFRVDDKGCYVLDSRDNTIERYSQKSFKGVLKSCCLISGVIIDYSGKVETSYNDSFLQMLLSVPECKKQLVYLQLSTFSY